MIQLNQNVVILTLEYQTGGTWIYCNNLALELSKLGNWKPTVIVAEREKKQMCKNIPQNYELVKIPTSNSRLFYFIQYWKQSAKEVKRRHPRIVQGNMNLMSSKGIRKHGYKIIETVHTTFTREKRGLEGENVKRLNWVEKRIFYMFPILYYYEKKLLKRADHLIAVSNEIKQELIKKHTIQSEKISVIPNGVNTDLLYRNQGKLYCKRSEDEFVLGYLGRMMSSKGILLLFPLLKILKERIPKIKLLLAGDYVLSKKYLFNLAKQYSVADLIVFLDYLYGDKLKREFYNSIDLFILPSKHEGMNLTLLEAMACETPIIASEESVTFEHNGTIITAERSVESFYNAIVNAYETYPTLKKNMRKARELVKNYSWKKMAQEIEIIYQQML